MRRITAVRSSGLKPAEAARWPAQNGLTINTSRLTSTTACGKLLQWLLRYPFQRVQDWALAQGVDQSTAFRQIKQGEQRGWLASVQVTRVTNAARLYYLSAQGLEAVARLLGVDPVTLAVTFGVDERSLLRQLARLPILVQVQQVVNSLLAEAPSVLSSTGAPLALTWQWQREYRHGFLSHQQRWFCEAEAVLVWHLRAAESADAGEDRWYSLWLLLDSGLTDQQDERIIRRRLERLLHYRECEERAAFHRWFPPVLILVQTRRQQDVWRRSAQEVTASLHLSPLLGAIAFLSAETDRPDAWHLDWKTLLHPIPCHLLDLLSPLPKEALPAGVLEERRVPVWSASASSRKRFVALPGDLMQRAQRLSLASRGGEAERATTALLSLRLAPGHVALLQLLYTAPMLSTSEVASLFEVQEASAARSLTELRQAGCLCAFTTACGRRWWLSSRGLRLLAARLHLSLQHMAAPVSAGDFPHPGQRVSLTHEISCGARGLALTRACGTILSTEGGVSVVMDEPLAGGKEPHPVLRWQVGAGESLLLAFSSDCALVEAKAPLEWVQRSARQMRQRLLQQPAAVRHLAGIYGFVARLHRAACTAGQALLWWEVGSRCQRRYRDQDRWRILRPDALLSYRAGTRQGLAWLQWQEGTRSHKRLAATLDAYAAYVQSHAWQQEERSPLPLLLLVVTSTEQEQYVSQSGERLLQHCGLTVGVTTAARLSVQELLAPLWKPILPIQQRPAVRYSLPDLLHGLT